MECSCGNLASPACPFLCCGRCCNGCSRHPYVGSESEAGPQPGEPGSCRCGQVASPACDYLLCASCCNGCSRHAHAMSEAEIAPQAGEPGSCRCGQVASPACDYLLCGKCCNGCRRHLYESEQESEVAPRPGEPGSCSCGQTASPQCDNLLCANCCSGCRRHAHAGDAEEDAASEQHSYGLAEVQHLYCSCGQCASRRCALQLCRTCCWDADSGCCDFHGRPPTPYEPSEDWSSDDLLGPPWLFEAAAQLGFDPSRVQHHVGVAAAVARTAQQPAAAAAARSSSDAAGSRDQQAGAAAGAGSSGTTAQPAAPPCDAAEVICQLQSCVVCLDQPRSVLLLPCKHLCLCTQCMVRLQRQARQELAMGASTHSDVLCPVCRVPAASMLPGVILS